MVRIMPIAPGAWVATVSALPPAQFRGGKARVCASWMSGEPIKPDRGASLFRMAVFQQGLNPSAYSIHSLRAGGAAALYRAAGHIELADRMGRRETRSISSYLRGSPNNEGIGKVNGPWGPHFT